ncbi:bifunctional DNA primase/polymerase [Sporosarcina sp. FSL W7-1283]|uniref:bifunctional DNA primase/polymerase n=1 Tax=Sporosarcina sp. FSL W7-1283 TaxID=2921560 RepID=UPI0030F8FFEA
MSLTKRSAKQLLKYGLVSMPLNGKKPLLKKWPQYFIERPLSKQNIENGLLTETGKLITYDDSKNLGILTGAISNCIVIDIDDMGVMKKINQLGGLPETWTSKTRRGFHLYFNYDKNIHSTSLWSQIDVLSDGKQAVAPPSWNVEGRRYEWVISPKMVTKADLPYWFIKLLSNTNNGQEPSPTVYTNTNEFKRSAYESALQSVNWLGVFSKHTSNIRGNGRWKSSKCPFHNDKNNSFSFCATDGGWICHAGCGKGNGLHFLERIYGISKRKAWLLINGKDVYV